MNDKGINVLSLFDGMSCGRIALERAGIKVDKYYASEIDKAAIAISKKNYPSNIPLGDVTQWRSWDIIWHEIDTLMGGSPCQSLSITQSKTRQNLDGKSKLFFYYADIKNHINEERKKIGKPECKFLFENVASMNEESKKAISNCLGGEPIFINSSLVSAQERPRYYWTNIENISQPKDKNLYLKDVLEDMVDEKYFYNKEFIYHGDKSICATLNINGHDILKRVHSPNFKCHTLTTCGGGNTQKKILIDGRVRKLTPVEYERLQTVPDNYTDGVANTHRYTMLGNGWTVDVIAHILKGLNSINSTAINTANEEQYKLL